MVCDTNITNVFIISLFATKARFFDNNVYLHRYNCVLLWDIYPNYETFWNKSSLDLLRMKSRLSLFEDFHAKAKALQLEEFEYEKT